MAKTIFPDGNDGAAVPRRRRSVEPFGVGGPEPVDLGPYTEHVDHADGGRADENRAWDEPARIADLVAQSSGRFKADEAERGEHEAAR
jgi:hypothetical protein